MRHSRKYSETRASWRMCSAMSGCTRLPHRAVIDRSHKPPSPDADRHCSHSASLPLPGNPASEGLSDQVCTIGSAVNRGEVVAAEIVKDILHPGQKISGDGVFDTAAD